MIVDKHHEDSESTTANDNAGMVPSLNVYQLEWFPAWMVTSWNGYQLEWLPAWTLLINMKCGQFVFVYNLVTRNLPGKKLFS